MIFNSTSSSPIQQEDLNKSELLGQKRSSYTDQLFSKGLRARYHYARFYWLKCRLEKMGCHPLSVLELGCGDAKTVSFLPVRPTRYVGLDSNLENLAFARTSWPNDSYEFYQCSRADDITLSGLFDISISMETFDCIPPDLIEGYVRKLSELTLNFLFVTASIQNGLGFGIKHVLRFAGGMNPPHYTLLEFLYSIIGNMQKVERKGREGWDYRRLEPIITDFRTSPIAALFPGISRDAALNSPSS